jgi:hypothetical protein
LNYVQQRLSEGFITILNVAIRHLVQMKSLAGTGGSDVQNMNRQDSDSLAPISEHREEIEQLVDSGKLPTHLNSLARVLLALEAGRVPSDGDLRATGLPTEGVGDSRTRRGERK